MVSKMYKEMYSRWLAANLDDPDLKPELESIQNDDAAIQDRFAVALKFGTAGLRGVIGAGTNRMNVYVVRQATQGLANWVKTQGGSQTVAISYDSRLKSDIFAKTAAGVLAANGIKVRIYDALIDAHITRQDFVVALGGGVVGDIAGYAACTYLRGVRFIQAPTTLLAQVDSSVGGKVAVNHPRGKNLLGAFYQPELVMIDCDTLKTLDARQVGAGLGEVIKYGCIADEALFETLREKISSRVELIEMENAVNDEAFAMAAAQKLIELMKNKTTN